MSFGSENPEIWDEICKTGIANKLRTEMVKNGFDDIDEHTLGAVVEIIYASPKMFTLFMDWAQDDVCASESDYWGTKVDEAVMRHEAKEGY